MCESHSCPCMDAETRHQPVQVSLNGSTAFWSILPSPHFSSWGMTIILRVTLIFFDSWEGCTNIEQTARWDSPSCASCPPRDRTGLGGSCRAPGQIQAASVPQQWKLVGLPQFVGLAWLTSTAGEVAAGQGEPSLWEEGGRDAHPEASHHASSRVEDAAHADLEPCAGIVFRKLLARKKMEQSQPVRRALQIYLNTIHECTALSLVKNLNRKKPVMKV